MDLYFSTLKRGKNSKTLRKIKLPIISGLLASLCWIIGDLLLVGFTSVPKLYPLFSETYASKVDIALSTLMLQGSTNRLMCGVFFAIFSMPFYLYSLLAIGKLLNKKSIMPVFILLLIGFSYMPLGHAGFFYVGEIYKAILATDVIVHTQLLETANGFVQILKTTWVASFAITTLGWLVFGFFVGQGKTVFKRSAVWMNPILFTFIFFLIAKLLPSPAQDYIGCAAFNEANFVFFLMLLFFVLKKEDK